MDSYTVRLIYNKGEATEYVFPLVQGVTEPKAGAKSVVIRGNRGDGSIVIDGGKASQEISIKGILYSDEGYVDLMSKLNTMKSNIGTGLATITKEWFDTEASGGGDWETTWSYTVKRIEPITFADSLQTDIIEIIKESDLAKKAETLSSRKEFDTLLNRLAKRIFKEIQNKEK